MLFLSLCRMARLGRHIPGDARNPGNGFLCALSALTGRKGGTIAE
jgi:hypothetical protein